MAREDYRSYENHQTGLKLATRIKDVAKNKKVDVRKGLQRYACEEVVRSLTIHSKTRFTLKGGLLYPIDERQTDDADIVFQGVRSSASMMGDLQKAANYLEASGLVVNIKKLAKTPHGFKVPLQVIIGDTRVDTKLDIGFGGQIKATSSENRVFKSFLKDAQPFTVLAQTWESHAVDKFIAVLDLGLQNTRLKDFRDLYRLKDKGLDNSAIAAEMWTRLSRRGFDPNQVFNVPASLSYEFAEANSGKWGADVILGGDTVPDDFEEVVSDLEHWYRDIAVELRKLRALACSGGLTHTEPEHNAEVIAFRPRSAGGRYWQLARNPLRHPREMSWRPIL